MDAPSSSSPARVENPAVNDGVACSTLIAMNGDTRISAENGGISENQEKEHIAVEEEEGGNMDVDEENEGDDGETRGLEGEDFTQIFKVGDEVWETKNFSKWSKLNWLCFSQDYDFNDSFFHLSNEDFDPGEDPRSGRRLELKMGHSLLDYPFDAPWADWYFKEASEGARVAIEFFNKENKMGKTFEFHMLPLMRMGLHFHKPPGKVYFITIMATCIDDVSLKIALEASLFRPFENKKVWHLRAVRTSRL